MGAAASHHEYNECYLYYSFMEQETDPRIKAMWELHLNMELAHLQQRRASCCAGTTGATRRRSLGRRAAGRR